eukprot:scaffold239504_cov35-Tisochrysis_lutea.AAC.2
MRSTPSLTVPAICLAGDLYLSSWKMASALPRPTSWLPRATLFARRISTRPRWSARPAVDSERGRSSKLAGVLMVREGQRPYCGLALIPVVMDAPWAGDIATYGRIDESVGTLVWGVTAHTG